MKVIKNYLYNAMYQVFILLIPLVTTPYLARVLGPTGVGINSYTNSIIQYFILIGSIGVNLYGNREIAFVRGNKKEVTKTFYEIFFMRMVTVVGAYLLFCVFMLLIHQYRTFYLAQSISIIAAAFDISWFFMGMENFAVTVLRNFIIKVITLISIFTLVKSDADLVVYIGILSISLLLGNLTLFPSLRKYIGVPKWRSLNIWSHLGPSLLLFVPQIATQIYLVVNKTMLGTMTSVQAAGYFDQSDKMVKMILAIVTATGTVMLPHVANAFANGEHEKTLYYLYKSFSFVTALATPLMFGLAALSYSFVPLFFTKRFSAVVPLMMIESVVILLIAWSNVLGTQYLLPTKQVRTYSHSVILGAIVNIVLNIPLIMLWGAIGTAVATVVSELAVTLYQLLMVKEQVNYVYLFKGCFKYFLSGIVMFAIVFALNIAIKPTWIIIIEEVFVGICTYTGMLFVLRAEIIYDSLNLIFKDRQSRG